MIYFWKPRSSSINTSITTLNVENVGHSNVDGITNATVAFTTHGIVYSYARLHNDRIFSTENIRKLYQNYFTHYHIVYKGLLWRGKSWDGEISNSALNGRSITFANEVALLAKDVNGEELQPRKETINERDIARMHAALNGLVGLFISLIKSTFPRMGMVWSSKEDYPLELRTAINVLNKQGGAIEGR